MVRMEGNLRLGMAEPGDGGPVPTIPVAARGGAGGHMPPAPSERGRRRPNRKNVNIFLVTEMSRFRSEDLMSAPGARARLFVGYPMLLCHHFNLKLTFSFVQVFQLGKYKRRVPECSKGKAGTFISQQ